MCLSVVLLQFQDWCILGRQIAVRELCSETGANSCESTTHWILNDTPVVCLWLWVIQLKCELYLHFCWTAGKHGVVRTYIYWKLMSINETSSQEIRWQNFLQDQLNDKWRIPIFTWYLPVLVHVFSKDLIFKKHEIKRRESVPREKIDVLMQ